MGIPDLFLIYGFMKQLFKRRNIYSAVFNQFLNFLGRLQDTAGVHIKIHNRRIIDIMPDILRFLRIIHANQRPVECPYRHARDALYLDSGFPERPPGAYLERAFRSASFQYQPVFSG